MTEALQGFKQSPTPKIIYPYAKAERVLHRSVFQAM